MARLIGMHFPLTIEHVTRRSYHGSSLSDPAIA
jgi:hypothetical protein